MEKILLVESRVLTRLKDYAILKKINFKGGKAPYMDWLFV